jgi:hypothetical protein
MNDAAQLRKMPKVRFFMGSARLPGSRIKMKLKQLTSSPGRQQTAKTGNTAILRAYRLAINRYVLLSSILTYGFQEQQPLQSLGRNG